MNNWMPSVEVESAHGTREVSLQTRHLMNRNIFLHGEVNADMANNFLSEFMYLENESADPITVYVNSPGGEVNSGLMIYDIIQASKVPVNMVCSGMAASMGAVIMVGGQKGRRYILPHSKMMIHEPLMMGDAGGSATSIKKKAESILETKALVNGIIAKHTGKTLEEIDEATSFDNYMNAEEAIEFGLCDRILEGSITVNK